MNEIELEHWRDFDSLISIHCWNLLNWVQSRAIDSKRIELWTRVESRRPSFTCHQTQRLIYFRFAIVTSIQDANSTRGLDQFVRMVDLNGLDLIEFERFNHFNSNNTNSNSNLERFHHFNIADNITFHLNDSKPKFHDLIWFVVSVQSERTDVSWIWDSWGAENPSKNSQKMMIDDFRQFCSRFFSENCNAVRIPVTSLSTMLFIFDSLATLLV